MRYSEGSPVLRASAEKNERSFGVPQDDMGVVAADGSDNLTQRVYKNDLRPARVGVSRRNPASGRRGGRHPASPLARGGGTSWVRRRANRAAREAGHLPGRRRGHNG